MLFRRVTITVSGVIMSYLETIKYDSTTNDLLKTEQTFYKYQDEDVQVITIFKDINTAIVEDKNGRIFEISTDELK